MQDIVISRETIKSVIDAAAGIEALLADVPHGIAKAIIENTHSIVDMVTDDLPGGLYTFCEACELPIGCDEESATDPEGGATLCGDCLKHYETDGTKLPETTKASD